MDPHIPRTEHSNPPLLLAHHQAACLHVPLRKPCDVAEVDLHIFFTIRVVLLSLRFCRRQVGFMSRDRRVPRV